MKASSTAGARLRAGPHGDAEVTGINRVVCDVTPKPPEKIEWERAAADCGKPSATRGWT